jgi:hypothetical protein
MGNPKHARVLLEALGIRIHMVPIYTGRGLTFSEMVRREVYEQLKLTLRHERQVLADHCDRGPDG